MKLSFIQNTFALCCMGLLASYNGNAQPGSPADCRQGCTSNDVKIIRAYLVDPNTGLELDNSFACTGSAVVQLGLDLTTKTPRVGVVLFANIRDFTNDSIGAVLTTTKQCFANKALNQPTNSVVFQQTFSWTCGMPIVLTDVFIGWGTGNTDFCGGSILFRCPATPSKCYQLPPGQYIPIQIPQSSSASATRCAAPGGTTATFDLTKLDSAVADKADQVVVTWYGDSTLSMLITDSAAFVSDDTVIYAKVSNGSNSSVYSRATVTLTVTDAPAAPSICAIQPSLCGPAKGSIFVLSPTGTGYEYSIDSGTTWQDSTNFLGLAAGSNPTIIARLGGCISTAALCSDAGDCNIARVSSNRAPASPKKALRSAMPRDPAAAGELQVKAYPNPFQNSVSFNFTTPISGRVLLEVFDVTGRRVAATSYGFVEAGTVRTVTLNMRKNLNSLVLYRLSVGRKSVSGRLLQKD
jgi:hypothetical protein